MSKRAFSRAFDMPTIDPDKEDEHEAYIGVDFSVPEINLKIDGKVRKVSWTEIVANYNGIDAVVECPIIEKAAKSGCDHSWESYTGLSESFEFCKHCDEKR